MRRYLGAASVLAIASLLLFLSLLLPLVAAPALKKAPLDPDSTSTSVGEVTYFSVAEGEEVTTDQLQNTRVTRGDVAAGDDDIAVYLTFTTNEDLAADEDARELSTYGARFAFDRVTGEAVNCCDEDPEGHEGLYLKFPFDTQQQDYELWDETLQGSAPAVFEGTDEIEGLEVYRFSQSIPRTEIGTIDIGGEEATDFYQVDKDLWVDPVTGTIIDGQQEVLRTFEADGEVLVTATSGTIGFSDETVAANVTNTRDNIAALRLVSSTIPLIALIAGALLLALGIFMAARAREDGAVVEPPPTDARTRTGRDRGKSATSAT